MNKMLLTSQWLIAAAACVLLCTLLVGGSVWAQTATLPSAPAIASLTPSDQAITVVWTAPASNGGSDITSYDLRHIGSDATDKADDNWTGRNGILDGAGGHLELRPPAIWAERVDRLQSERWTSGALEYALSGLTNGVRYDVQVRAVNDAGDGPWSAIATDTPRTTPGAPTIDVVSPGNYALSITWSAPADDGGADITSYDLRYIRSDATDKADDSWTVREDIWSSGLLQYGLNESTGFNLSGGVRYDVQVRAVNAVGNGSWSASETGTPRSPSQPVTVPGAPASLLVTPGDGSLSIAWSAPADDGGADVTSYDLRYILSDVQDRSDASWTVEEDVWSSGALEYTLSSLTNGASYDVQVRAVNEAGNGPWSASETGTPSCPLPGRRRQTTAGRTSRPNRSPHPVRPRPSW
jgi:titin